MAYRYALAAVLLAALSIPAAAQQTTPSDTSKKSSTGVTTSTSNGAIADTAAKPSTPTPNTTTPTEITPPSTMPSTPSPNLDKAGINPPAATPSTAPSTSAPSTGTSVTAPAPSSGAASTSPSGVTSAPSAGASAPMGAEGQVQPTSGNIKVQVKVDPSLANTAKISADSAFALAKASPDAGEISSAELEMTDKRLVYQVKMVKGAGASTVYVDAMTGEVVKDKKFGGLKAAAENQEESQKLYDAKKDSSAAKKP